MKLKKVYWNPAKDDKSANYGFVGMDDEKAYCYEVELATAFLRQNNLVEKATGRYGDYIKVLKNVEIEVDEKGISFASGQSASTPADDLNRLADTYKWCAHEASSLFNDEPAQAAAAATMFIAAQKENLWVTRAPKTESMEDFPEALDEDPDPDCPF
jgi:hypothetical protein